MSQRVLKTFEVDHRGLTMVIEVEGACQSRRSLSKFERDHQSPKVDHQSSYYCARLACAMRKVLVCFPSTICDVDISMSCGQQWKLPQYRLQYTGDQNGRKTAHLHSHELVGILNHGIWNWCSLPPQEPTTKVVGIYLI
jgi:hypothetical protein